MKPVQKSYWLPTTIVATFIAVTGFAIASYVNTVRLHKAELLVEHSYAVREAANQFLTGMREAETGQRGFLITGNETFLEPFYQGVQKAESQFDRLKRLAKADNKLLDYVEQLKSSYERQQVHLRRTIELRRANLEVSITDDLIALVQSGVGKVAMDNAQKVTADILTLEDQRLRESESRSSYLTTISQTTISIGNLLATGMIIAIGIAAWTDRKKRDAAELSLVRGQDELAAVIDSAFEGIMTLGKDLSIRFMNPSAAKIFQVDRETIEGQNFLSFVPEAQRELTRISYAELFGSQESSREFHDRPMIRSDGAIVPISGSEVRTELENDGLITVRFRDRSDAKASEAKQREYMAVLQQINDALLVCDIDGTIRSYNDAAVKLLSQSQYDLVGSNISTTLNADSEQWAKYREKVLETGVAINQQTWNAPKRCELIIEQRLSLIRDNMSMPIGILVFLIDVTDRVRQEVNERRAQRLESIGTLAGGIAHDLNNVLTPIMVSVELLQRGSKSPERLMKNIVISADRGSRMIKKLLAFAGGDRPQRAPLDLREVLTEVRELLTHTLPPSIEVSLDISDRLQLIDGDRTELSQVVMNLALNARDAMPNGGRLEIRVENFTVDPLRAKQSGVLLPGPHLLLSVSDSGEGIPQEIMDRIYDPFFTTKPQGKGTGLGLSTTLGIVRSYGGDMTAYSELGTGTRFNLYLPCSNSPTVESAIVEQDHEIPFGRGETVLLVDDEELILDSGRESLEANHYSVLTARSGTEAIDVVQRKLGQIDLVILDMMMPGMDGLQTAASLRQVAPNLNVLASSGLRRPSQSPDNFELFCGFLPKPYSVEQLLLAVRTALDKR